MVAKHTSAPPILDDESLVALVEAKRAEHERRTPREAWRIHSSALRRWKRQRRLIPDHAPPSHAIGVPSR